MERLSDRLRVIADYVRPGETVADIGTDHGLLPVELVRSGRCPRAVMTDISAGSLAKARLLGADYIAAGSLDAREGDGLKPLLPGEVDTVVLAGLGGNLMIDILGDDPEKAAGYPRYILQPRKATGRLRCYLYEQGYAIAGERIADENGHLCEILSVVSPGGDREGCLLDPLDPAYAAVTGEPDHIQWEIPLYYGRLTDPLMTEYLERKLQREERNLNNQSKAKEPDEAVLAATGERIAYIKERLEERR